MIRINLLPVRQSRRVQAGTRQIAMFLVLTLVAVGVMFFLYETKSSEVEDRQRAVNTLRRDISRLKKQVGDFNRLKMQRNRLLQQRKVIEQLHAARTGPVHMLRELSDILSEGKGPTINQQHYEKILRRDPTAGFNPRWNPRRLWIETLDEKDGALSLAGKAKDHDDVAELLKRLTLSEYFTNVQLSRNDQMLDRKAGFKVVRFKLTCNTTY
ncbi:MAG: hypothetical protein CSA65_04595 [Proteobacteria bacterium]|nr:MAG: hypothetical protein CSB49_02945 [Pseudomonadota bacterium]PIE18567.1 MAG: hypothetical protein CSA65_04595 [Pseudomonadota bacterium]